MFSILLPKLIFNNEFSLKRKWSRGTIGGYKIYLTVLPYEEESGPSQETVYAQPKKNIK